MQCLRCQAAAGRLRRFSQGGGMSDFESRSQRFVALNAAYQVLREPKDRLLHLLELELGAKPTEVQPTSPGAMELFLEVGRLCREVQP